MSTSILVFFLELHKIFFISPSVFMQILQSLSAQGLTSSGGGGAGGGDGSNSSGVSRTTIKER